MQIRPMRGSDLDEVAEIEKENFSVPWKKEDFSGYIDFAYAIFLTAEEDGKVAGYIGAIVTDEEGDIVNVSVRPDRMGAGLGTALVRCLLHETDGRGIARVFLEVRESNERAIRLYEAAGFRQVGIRKDYYQKPTEDALLMRRDLGAGLSQTRRNGFGKE